MSAGLYRIFSSRNKEIRNSRTPAPSKGIQSYFPTRKYFFSLCFVSALLALPISGLTAGTIDVCQNGCTLSSIQSAVKQAKPGDLILVQSGHYREGTVEVHKPVTIRGLENVTVDGEGKKHVFYIRADRVRIENLTIQNSGMSYVSDYAGIRAEHVKECSFTNNRLLNNTYGIYLEKVSDCTIQNNTLQSDAKARGEVKSGNGIHLFYSNRISVVGNRIQGHRDGLYFEYTDGSIVNHNVSHNNLRFGMHFMFSHNNEFKSNTFQDNQTGVAIMYSRNLTVEDNLFAFSTGAASYGFLIKEITDSTFKNNLFYRNSIAITMNSSNRNRFIENGFYQNGWAAEIYSNSYDNIFRNNNFIHNHFAIGTNSTRNTNLFELNYYSEHRGYDLDRNGMADRPYKLVSVFGYWVVKFPSLAVLLNSPAVIALELSEKAFPVITSATLEDQQPRMAPVKIESVEQKLKELQP